MELKTEECRGCGSRLPRHGLPGIHEIAFGIDVWFCDKYCREAFIEDYIKKSEESKW